MYIYKLTDKNGLTYIGKTNDIEKRFSVHKCRKNDTSAGRLDFDSIKKEILEECPENLVQEREKYWINNTECVNVMRYNYNDLEYKRRRNEWIRSWGKHTGSDNNMFFINLF